MMTLRASLVIALFGAGCVGDAPASPLLLDTATSDHVEGSFTSNGETFSISAHAETRTPPINPDVAVDQITDRPTPDFVVRVVTVRSATGDVVASWTVADSDDETVGTIDGHPFGGANNELSDDDTAQWQAVVASPAGDMLAALSRGAQDVVAMYPDAAAFLADFSHITPVVTDMAGSTDDVVVPPDETAMGAVYDRFTVLGWDFGSGPNRRIILIPNQGNAIGVHSASNDLAISRVHASMLANPDNTLGIREIEPDEYNSSRAYRLMVDRLIREAQGGAPGLQPILVMFNSGSNGSHDPMTTLPGVASDGSIRTGARRALRAMLRNHPTVRLSVELYCAGNMTDDGWRARRVHLGEWAVKMGIPRTRVTVDEDLSSTTAWSGEHYGTMGQTDHFNAALGVEADKVKEGGWAGLDYVATGPDGQYPTLPSTFDAIHEIEAKY